MRLNKALLTTAVALSLAVAGCSGGSSDGGAAQEGPVTSELRRLGPEPGAGAQADDRRRLPAANKNIKVKVQVTPYEQYFTKLQAAADRRAAPDVFWMNGPNFQLYASNGVLAPISTRDQQGQARPRVYPKSLVDLYTFDGKEFGLPKDFDTIGVWYNKTLFDAAKVSSIRTTTGPGRTSSAAAKLTDKTKGVYGIRGSLEGPGRLLQHDPRRPAGTSMSPDGKTRGYDDPADASRAVDSGPT